MANDYICTVRQCYSLFKDDLTVRTLLFDSEVDNSCFG